MTVKHLIQQRSKVTFQSCHLPLCQKYLALSPSQRAKFVPAPRGTLDPLDSLDSIVTVDAFLQKIGRSTADYSSKFTSWNHFFESSSSQMASLGIKTKQRKYIISCREWYKRGVDLVANPIKIRPNRQKQKPS